MHRAFFIVGWYPTVMDDVFIFVEYNSTVMDGGVTKPLQKSY